MVREIIGVWGDYLHLPCKSEFFVISFLYNTLKEWEEKIHGKSTKLATYPKLAYHCKSN